MPQDHASKLLVIVTPNFNILATTGLIDPLRAVNYLSGNTQFTWVLASVSGGGLSRATA